MFEITKRRQRKGLVIGFGLLAVGFIYVLIDSISHYNGFCGGWWSFASSSYKCSLIEYLRGDLWFTWAITSGSPVFWLTVCSIIIVPALIGYTLDRPQTKGGMKQKT